MMMTMTKTATALFVAFSFALCSGLTEDARQAEFYKRGYTWPPEV
jgi:hypothetical protein